MAKQKVVIVGGGFGGVKAALRLAGSAKFEVTLISDNLNFRFYPTLFRTATGGKRMISSISLAHIFQGKPVKIINEKVVSHGPFVMNTETQILEAMRDYKMGKMGVLIEE